MMVFPYRYRADASLSTFFKGSRFNSSAYHPSMACRPKIGPYGLTPTTSFGEARGHRGGIVAVVGRVKLLEERAQPLAQLWIGRVVGWAKLGAAKRWPTLQGQAALEFSWPA
jgi:hypothetical protein